MRFFNSIRISTILCSVFLLVLSSCSHKIPVTPSSFVRDGRFSYLQDQDGRWIIVTTNTKDLEDAMKKIQPGPASVDKLNLWIVTPLGKSPAN
jgi:hypothetical protein